MKVVIDTNILVSGVGDESSYAYKIIEEVIAGRLEAYATHQTMGENRQMLRKLVRDRSYRERLEEFFGKLNIIKVYEPLHVVSDEEDNKLFESAAASGAEYLITNDQEVLAIEHYHGTSVVSPADFWARYREQGDGESAWNDWSNMLLGK